MAMNVTPFVGTDNFNMETFNNMISQINNGVNSEISEVLAQLGTKAKIQTGSYVGTGTYGASNPCSLTFDFVPKIIFIYRIRIYNNFYSRTGETLLFINPHNPYDENWISNANTYFGSNYNTTYLNVKINGNTLVWYTTENANAQFNDGNSAGFSYEYLGIG